MVIQLNFEYEKIQEIIEKILTENITKNNIEIAQATFDNLVIHLSLCVSREMNGSYIATSESQIHNLSDHTYYPVSKAIIEQLEKEFNLTIDTNQVYYTTMYLANINLLDIDFNIEFDMFDDTYETIMHETIAEIKDKLNLDLKANEDFYKGMTFHFYPALDRLQNNQQLTNNPLMEVIRNENETEFACAKAFNSVVEKHYNKTFNEHELAYIALHFGTALM